MRAVLQRTEGLCQGLRVVEERAQVRSPGDADGLLLSEISRLGGDERMRGATGALEAFKSALTDLVRQNPNAYGAGSDPNSQSGVASMLFESVKRPFLLRTIETLRREAGYVNVCGHWIHRAVFTFFGFGLLAAAVLPLCAVSLMSSSAWGWLPGALGLAALFALGTWILSRIRSR